jgi:hypothetical protein
MWHNYIVRGTNKSLSWASSWSWCAFQASLFFCPQCSPTKGQKHSQKSTGTVPTNVTPVQVSAKATACCYRGAELLRREKLAVLPVDDWRAAMCVIGLDDIRYPDSGFYTHWMTSRLSLHEKVHKFGLHKSFSLNLAETMTLRLRLTGALTFLYRQRVDKTRGFCNWRGRWSICWAGVQVQRRLRTLSLWPGPSSLARAAP